MSKIPPTITSRCEICGKVRTGPYSGSDKYFHFYRCPQKDSNGVSHDFFVPTTRGRVRAVFRWVGGLGGAGAITKVVVDQVKKPDIEKNTTCEVSKSQASNGDNITDTETDFSEDVMDADTGETLFERVVDFLTS